MINAKEFIHPEDEAALRNMEEIPLFPTIVKKFMQYGLEKYIGGFNMASMIKLSPTQLPDIYHRLPPICDSLGIQMPEFYLQMDPYPNAMTTGNTRVFLTVTSGLLEYLDDNEINSVLAHECGHIAFNHVLYHTMANLLVSGGEMLGVLSNIALPIKYALLYWSRKSELSADRAGAVVCGVDSILQTQVRLAGGPKSITKNINIEEWAKQADEYEEIRDGGTWDKTLQILATMNNDHPFAAVRVREILKWSKTEQYANIINHKNDIICPNCGKRVDKEWSFCKYCGEKLKK